LGAGEGNTLFWEVDGWMDLLIELVEVTVSLGAGKGYIFL
jgi:hypothetical protein